MLMKTVQLTGAADYYSQMAMHTSTANPGIILARDSQKYISEKTRAHGLLDHSNYKKFASKWKWNESKYHVQYRKDVPHTSVKI